MRVDITSMFFNSKIINKTATPAWRTSLGQSANKECRIETDTPGVVDNLVGITYKAMSDLTKLDTKGTSGDILICSVFDKVFVNSIRVKGKYTMLVVRETSASHSGRMQLCYSPNYSYDSHRNVDTIDNMRLALGCSPQGCWFVYDISVKNQDELHFSAIVVDASNPVEYSGESQDRSKLWKELVDKEINQMISNLDIKEEFHRYLSEPTRFKSATTGELYWRTITSGRQEIAFLCELIKELFGYECDDIFVITKYEEAELLWNKAIDDDRNNFQNKICSAILGRYKDFLKERVPQIKQTKSCIIGPLQRIFYGAPGTGKSYTVDGICKKFEYFRTTFHPDSDYSTFVGCYKPNKEKVEKTIADTGNKDKDTLAIILQDRINNIGIQNQCDVLALFGYEYSESLSKLNKGDVKSLVGTALNKQPGANYSDNVYVSVGEGLYEKYGKKSASADSKITYAYSPQAFIKSYVKAWRMHENNDPVFLIIEEINRGNCAQIFGDLFQLLDRNEQGYSSYEIIPDDDLKNYIAEQGIKVSGVVNSDKKDISDKIENGDLLKLPPNLYIWATMNTSDQSLFPIDSAFKRRWDWKFVKITEGYEKDANGKPVMVTGEDGKETKKKLGWQIKLSDGKTQDWWKFILKINEIIASMTSSADKQLGYFFCKPDLDKTTISAETFVSKVIFYLWNDVFKDFGFEDASLFRYKEKADDKEEKDLTFPDFYDEDGEMVNTTRLIDFVNRVMNWKKTKEDND